MNFIRQELAERAASLAVQGVYIGTSSWKYICAAVLRDYERRPVKPCGLGEGAYEDGPQYSTKPINALLIRRQACWSWFAGGYHTYGI